jgi:hypothetical protein
MQQEVQRLAAQGWMHPLATLLPQGQAFPAAVPGLISDLQSRLRIDPAVLDNTEASLAAVDAAIHKLRRARRRLLTPEVFGPLIAYVGEVIRHTTGGQWEMRLAADGKTWEPWIVDRAGRSYAPFMIFKELNEHGRSSSLSGFVGGTLRSHLLSSEFPPS